jgi:Cu+-exporting ATPase
MDSHDHHAAVMADRDPATDPVCGMTVDRAKAHRLEHGGTTHYFCSEHCMHRFQAEARDRSTPAISVTPFGEPGHPTGG